MWLNDAARMIEQWWLELNRKFPMVQTDEFLVMPSHFHGVITITDDPGGRPMSALYQKTDTPPKRGTQVRPYGGNQWFKTMTTNEYIRGVKTASWHSFNGRLWQRTYFEHIIRNEESLNRIRQYIFDNPARWEFDRENPAAKNPESENAWRTDTNVGAGLKPALTAEN
jgi:REP element-mobilizing transposase RayT